MIKWAAFWLALFALFTAADERKVRDQFDRVEARLSAIEDRKCLLMAVSTPTGTTSICATASDPRP